jgi:hypothetical protein
LDLLGARGPVIVDGAKKKEILINPSNDCPRKISSLLSDEEGRDFMRRTLSPKWTPQERSQKLHESKNRREIGLEGSERRGDLKTPVRRSLIFDLI